MGIQGLFKELSRKGYDGEDVLLSRPCFKGKSIVVDASFLIYKFSVMKNGRWEYCGNFVEIFDYVKEYVTAFHDAGINLIVVTDGAVEKSKLQEWKERRESEAKSMYKLFDLMFTKDKDGNGPMSINSKYFSPPLGKMSIGEAFRYSGCEVITSMGEADKEIARICHTRKCIGVISGDSDFIAFRVPMLILKTNIRRNKIIARCYKLEKIKTLLNVEPIFFPLLGTLTGNDFVSKDSLARMHERIMEMYPSESLLESLAELINSGKRKKKAQGVTLTEKNVVEWIKSTKVLSYHADKFAISLDMYDMKAQAKCKIDQVGGADSLHVIQAMEARANETDNIFPRFAYSILNIEHFSCGVFMEVPPRIASWDIYRDIRLRIYALLFSLKQSEKRPLREIPIETMALSTIYADSKFCIEKIEHPDADFYDSLPPEYKFSSYKEAISAPFENQLGLYFKCVGLDDYLIKIFVPFLKRNIECRAFYGVISSIYYLKQQRAISLASLKAQLYQAHLIMTNPSVVHRIPQLPIDGDLTYEGSVFLHLHGLLTTINCACGFPIHEFATNKVYQGTLFYYVHDLIVNNRIEDLVSLWEDPALYMEVEALAKVLLGDEEIPVKTIREYRENLVHNVPADHQINGDEPKQLDDEEHNNNDDDDDDEKEEKEEEEKEELDKLNKMIKDLKITK